MKNYSGLFPSFEIDQDYFFDRRFQMKRKYQKQQEKNRFLESVTHY